MFLLQLACVGFAAASATVESKKGGAGGNLKVMGFYGFDPDAQHGWTNLGMEGSASLKIYAKQQYNLSSLYGSLENVFDREKKGLYPDWQATLTKMMHEEFAPLYANGTYSGVFLGDEICCAGVPLADLQQVLTMLRSLVGPDAILYTNECGEMASWPKVPAELDYISMDVYAGYEPPGDPAKEVAAAKAFYETSVFPKLSGNQAALLVPGTFACSNLTYFPLEAQDKVVAQKLQLFYAWAQTEPKIAGFNPWHFHNRSSPQHPPPCDMQLGLEAMPTALGVMKQIGREIVGG